MKARLCLAVLPLLLCRAALAFTTDSTGKTIYTDGSSSDVQAAINAASDGWTVVLPDGAHSWSSTVAISGKGIHLKGSSANAVSISGSASPKIDVNKDSSHPVEISGIKFPSGGSLKIRIGGSWAARPVIIHDCAFFENLSASMLFLVNGGLIYNCSFTGSGGYNDQAVKVKSQSDDGGQWNSPDTLGLRDTTGERNVYVENCTFTNLLLQCFDFDGYARIVVRHSTFSDSAITSHGADTSPTGLRHFEVHNNRFIFHNYGDCDGSRTPNMDYFIYVRGGTGCIYSNVMDNMSSCAWGNKNEIKLTVYNITRKGGQVPCQTSYPAYQQIGQGHNGSGYFTDPLYIWGNSSVADVGVVQYFPDECGNGQKIGDYLQSGRDFITGTARPNYTTYTYPHPLRSSSVVPAQPATILANPTSQSVTQGTTLSLSALASGSSPMSYQWQKNQTNLPGATAASYFIGYVQSTDAGAYRCIAANAYGSATSAVANVTVVVPTPVAPTITASPQNLTRTVGELASFSVTASGSAPLTYQWQKNLVNLPGATNFVYTIASVATGDAGAYRCIVANSQGTATSSAATLTVNTAAVGRVWYVDWTAGNDSNAGTPSSPWKRCPGMVGWTGSATLQPGDTLYFDLADTWDIGANTGGAGLDLKAGVHYVGDEWSPQGTTGRRATLRAIGRHEAGVVRIWEDHATLPTWIEGFEINANGNRANLVDINHAFWKTGLTKATKRVEDCVAHSNAGNGSEGDYKYGIIISDNSGDASGWVANVEILNTKVYNVPRDGICLYPGDRGMISNVLVRGCEVYATGTDPSYSEGHGLMMKGNVKNSTFEFCYAHDVNSSAVFINGPEGGTGSGPTGGSVRYNLLQTADNNGVIRFYGTGTKAVDVYGNLVLPNEAAGGLSMSGNSGSIATRIYNNTFYNAYVDLGSPSSTGTIEFRNNLVYELDDAPLNDPSGRITEHANNLFFRSNGGTLVQSSGMSYTSTSLKTGYEPSAIIGDPLFKNAASLPTGFVGTYGTSLAPNTDGLSLLPGSPALNSGVSLGAAFGGSVNTIVRPGTGAWDVGAYQQGGGDIAPPKPPQGVRRTYPL